MWYPCSEPPGEIDLGRITLPAVKDCPIEGEKLPLVVLSHGGGSSFEQLYDTAEALADAGFVVASVTHPDKSRDASPFGFLSRMVERPTDVKRLGDFMLDRSPAASKIDPQRIGFYGFSLGGYTGLVLIGADPDWASVPVQCVGYTFGGNLCDLVRGKPLPTQPPVHDRRIKAAVLADPGPAFFGPDSFAAVKASVQLWASERGGPRAQVDAVERGLPAPHEYHVVANTGGAPVGHFIFFLCPPGLAQAEPEICTDAPGFDRTAFHKQFNEDVLAFFRVHLGDR